MNDALKAREAFTSLRTTMVFDVRDWSRNSRDAWLYGIIVGWDREALVEVAALHDWPPTERDRLRRYHKALCQAHGVEVGP
jgi:hypothetical protein